MIICSSCGAENDVPQILSRLRQGVNRAVRNYPVIGGAVTTLAEDSSDLKQKLNEMRAKAE